MLVEKLQLQQEFLNNLLNSHHILLCGKNIYQLNLKLVSKEKKSKLFPHQDSLKSLDLQFLKENYTLLLIFS